MLYIGLDLSYIDEVSVLDSLDHGTGHSNSKNRE